jgi:hypothetical protein
MATARDYFVLKPKHSGFFDTKLDTLLEALRTRRVVLTGMVGNICVLFTANDAHMRDYKICAPADCIVSNTATDNDHALRQIETVLKGNVAVSTRLRFQSSGRCAGTDTGHTSAHLTMVTDVRLSALVKRCGRTHAQAVWDAGLAAIARIDEIVRERAIDANSSGWTGTCTRQWTAMGRIRPRT